MLFQWGSVLEGKQTNIKVQNLDEDCLCPSKGCGRVDDFTVVHPWERELLALFCRNILCFTMQAACWFVKGSCGWHVLVPMLWKTTPSYAEKSMSPSLSLQKWRNKYPNFN